MNIKKNASEANPPAKHMPYAAMLETYVTILGTVLGLLFTWSQLRIAQNGEERARRAEPLAYTLEAVDTHYQYEIKKDGSTIVIPAPSLRLQVTHGSLHSITAISFDAAAFYELSSLPIQDSWDGCTVDIAMPAESVIIDGDIVYDYFFLFLEPTEGEGRLDLICNTIHLDTQEVQSSVSHPIALAQLEFLPQGPQQEMLSAYRTLWEKLKALGMLSA